MPRLADVRPACAAVAADANIIIHDEKIDRLLSIIDPSQFARTKNDHGLTFPLQFPTFHAHVNFVALLALLNAFSGYRAAFHQATGHGAADNMRRLLLGLYLSDDDALSAQALQRLSTTQLASLLGVPTHTEAQHPTLPFVHVGTVGGPLHAPLQLATHMLHQLGTFLVAEHKTDLGHYVLDACAGACDDPDLESRLLEALARVPGLDDATMLNGKPAYVYKKAFYLIYALRHLVTHNLPTDAPRIAHRLAARWHNNLPAPLPIFADNVLPTLLRHFGVLHTAHAHDEELRTWRISEEGVRLSHAAAYRMRAAAIAAAARIVERATIQMTETELDGYLWNAAKRPELRTLPRIAEQDTVMY